MLALDGLQPDQLLSPLIEDRPKLAKKSSLHLSAFLRQELVQHQLQEVLERYKLASIGIKMVLCGANHAVLKQQLLEARLLSHMLRLHLSKTRCKNTLQLINV
jgi:hypothetical protein